MGLLGKDSLTITDITDVNPIRLDLASSQPIYQTKRAGEKYEPDYINSPLIITPSLYLGVEEVSGVKYQNSEDKKHISFFINNIEVTKSDEEKGYILEIVDNKPILKITKNLTENILIRVNIYEITDERTGVTYDSISENLSFYLLSYDSSGYTAFIDSEGGRYDFSADNTAPIKLTAHLYLGNAELRDVKYEWSKSSAAGIIATTQDLIIERSDIYSHENFVCKMTHNKVTYTSACAIDDRTDLYTGAIISDAPLVMTPKFNTANLTCKIFRNGEEVNTGNINYSWVLYSGESSVILSSGSNNELKVTLGENVPKDNFSIYCTAVINEKYTTVSYLSISYSEPYTPILTPKNIFIPANNDGSYKGSEDIITKTFSFFLQGDDGAPLDVTKETLSINSIKGIPNISSELDKDEDNKNKYVITFSISVDDFNNFEESSMFELSYTYKGQVFNEEFYIIKSIQGSAGKDGIDGLSYSLILSNDYHRFAGKEVFAEEGQEVSTKISFFKGNEELPLEVIKIGNETTLTTEYQPVVIGLKAKLDKVGSTTGKIITFITTARELKKGGTIPIETKVSLNGEEKIFTTIFQYDINYEGNSYFLSFTNGTSISYLPSKDTFAPDKLAFYAYYRQNGLGENKLYTDGRVYVSIDGGEKEYLPPKITGGAYYEYIEVSNIKNSITFYLYNSLTKDAGLKDEYLMDRETIPILTSLEGAEIGGDNLLPFTRTLQWEIQNGREDLIEIKKDIDTNIANFKFNASNGDTSGDYKVCVLISPEIYIEEELEDKTFCISFYFKNDSENYFNEPLFMDGDIHISIHAYNGDNQLSEKSILYISNTSSNNAKVENEEIIEKGKWARVYQIFNLNIFSSDILSQATHYKIKIIGAISNISDFNYNFSIKKPKLEVGNTLTSWSMATNDILFEDLNIGINLEELDNQSLIDIISTQLNMISNNSGEISELFGRISFEIIDEHGEKQTITNLEDFKLYYDTNIGRVIDNKVAESAAVLNTRYDTLEKKNENLYKIANKITLGYDEKNSGKPYLLFDSAGGEENFAHNYSMKLTTDRLSFSSIKGDLAYFGNTSMTIKRAKIENQFYIGTADNGYLLVTTTPQGVGFIWSKDFVE